MGGQVVLLVLLLGIAGAIMEEIKEKMDTITDTGTQIHSHTKITETMTGYTDVFAHRFAGRRGESAPKALWSR